MKNNSVSAKPPSQNEWGWQWQRFKNDSEFMFGEWISPMTLKDFTGKSVLDAGCGGGEHLAIVAPYAARVVGVDLNTADVAMGRVADLPNVSVQRADLATMDLGEKFDIVYCVGVIQHTQDPDAVFANLMWHSKPGGRVIVWAYAYEGNFLVRTIVEGTKRALLLYFPKQLLRTLAYLITALVYLPVYTLYLLPLPSLPYYEYFRAWRTFSFARNAMNVFDKLNAPTTHFFRREKIAQWFSPQQFADIHISHFQGVSWRASGQLLPSVQ